MTALSNAPASVSSFSDLGVDAEITSILAGEGIVVPSRIQLLTLPDSLNGRDVCGKAQTGSGKTFAFGIPLVQGMQPSGPPKGLVLVPTRELCIQVAESIQLLAEQRELKVTPVYGGVSIERQIGWISAGTDIVVATPGRLLDLIDRNKISMDAIKTVVIDEADQMADLGFLPQVHDIMRRIEPGYQTMLFSATLDGQVTALVNSYMTDPVFHEVEERSDVVDTQEHRFIKVHEMDKAKVAAAIIRSAERTLVFVTTKRGADRVARRLRDEGVDAAAIHGDLRQRDREKALQRFTDGRIAALVATNVAARGLHIPEVDIVLHYEPPEDYKSFIHRSGRTARAGTDGLVVTLVEWDQIEAVQRIQKASGLWQEIVPMYSNDERLGDLEGFEPETVEFKQTTDAAISRSIRRRRRRRR